MFKKCRSLIPVQLVQIQQQLQEQLDVKRQESDRAAQDNLDALGQKDFLEKEIARLSGEIVMVREVAKFITWNCD
jgi:hypothetical protein